MIPDSNWLRDIVESGERFKRLVDSSDFARQSAELAQALNNPGVAKLVQDLNSHLATSALTEALNTKAFADQSRAQTGVRVRHGSVRQTLPHSRTCSQGSPSYSL